MQVDVGQMQPHRAPLCDLERLVEILARAVEVFRDGAVERAGEQGEGEVPCWPERRMRSTASLT